MMESLECVGGPKCGQEYELPQGKQELRIALLPVGQVPPPDTVGTVEDLRLGLYVEGQLNGKRVLLWRGER